MRKIRKNIKKTALISTIGNWEIMKIWWIITSFLWRLKIQKLSHMIKMSNINVGKILSNWELVVSVEICIKSYVYHKCLNIKLWVGILRVNRWVTTQII